MSVTESTVEYREIEGFPGYRVGNDGSVWSCWKQLGHGTRSGKHGGSHYVLGREWRRLKPGIIRGGHLGVVLSRGGKKHNRRVCALVLTAFVGQRPPEHQACHFPDRTPANCAIGNLRWGTAKNNAADRDKHGTTARGIIHGHVTLTDEHIRAIQTEYATLKAGRHKSPSGTLNFLAAKYGVGRTTIKRFVAAKEGRALRLPVV